MQNSSSRSKVIEEIVRKIHTNEYNKNTLISESELCEKMGLSRTPVREALIELAASGLLIKVPQKGYKVQEFDLKTKLDSYLVLAILDAAAAKLSVSFLTEADFLKMDELIDLIDVAIKYKNYETYNLYQEEFHQIYIDRCDNIPLQRQIMNFKNSIPSYLYYSDDQPRLFEVLLEVNNEHRQILSLLKAKKGNEVADFLIKTHWQTSYQDML